MAALNNKRCNESARLHGLRIYCVRRACFVETLYIRHIWGGVLPFPQFAVFSQNIDIYCKSGSLTAGAEHSLIEVCPNIAAGKYLCVVGHKYHFLNKTRSEDAPGTQVHNVIRTNTNPIS